MALSILSNSPRIRKLNLIDIGDASFQYWTVGSAHYLRDTETGKRRCFASAERLWAFVSCVRALAEGKVA